MYQVLLIQEQGDVGKSPLVESLLAYHHYQSPLSSRRSDLHWEIDYRKIIGIYRNFDGKLLHSYFTTVSEVFLELIAPLRPFQRCFGS